MTEAKVIFNDGAAYERFMVRWSRSVGRIFLDWLAASRDRHWLDVGCGTGAFTELVFNTCSPARLVAVDPSIDQIEYAQAADCAARRIQSGKRNGIPVPRLPLPYRNVCTGYQFHI